MRNVSGRLISKLPLNITAAPLKLYSEGNSGSGIPSRPMWLFLNPYLHVTLRGAGALPKTHYNEEVQSIHLNYVEFANKTANIKCKKNFLQQFTIPCKGV